MTVLEAKLNQKKRNLFHGSSPCDSPAVLGVFFVGGSIKISVGFCYTFPSWFMIFYQKFATPKKSALFDALFSGYISKCNVGFAIWLARAILCSTALQQMNESKQKRSQKPPSSNEFCNEEVNNEGILHDMFKHWNFKFPILGACHSPCWTIKAPLRYPETEHVPEKKNISKGSPLLFQPSSSWWFQPSWKILVKMGIFPK